MYVCMYVCMRQSVHHVHGWRERERENGRCGNLPVSCLWMGVVVADFGGKCAVYIHTDEVEEK